MNNKHEDYVIGFFIASIIFIIGFVIGLAVMYPKYNLSEEIIIKLQQDAELNYRTNEKQIGYIISNYYKEVRADDK